MKFGALPKYRIAISVWLLVALAAAVVMARFMVVSEATIAEQRAQALGSANESAIQYRVDNYELAIEGLAALFSLNRPVDDEQFRSYVLAAIGTGTLDGVKSIGFVEPVGTEIPDVLLGAGRDAVRVPPPIGSGERFIIRKVEPITTNRTAIGLDIATTKASRDAAIRSRSSGQSLLSSSLSVAYDPTVKHAFVLFKPVYRAGSELETEAQRLAAFKGWVIAQFAVEEALGNLSQFENKLYELAVFDGTNPNAASLIYQSPGGSQSEADSDFSYQGAVNVYGRDWTLRIKVKPQFQAGDRTNAYLVILVVVAFLVLVPLLLIISHDTRHRRVEQQVGERTEELQAQVSLTQSLVDGGLLSIFVFDDDGNCLISNDSAEEILTRAADTFDRDHFFQQMRQATNLRMRGHIRLPAIGNSGPKVLSVSRQEWMNSRAEPRHTYVLQDSTLEYVAVQKAKASEQRLKLALNVSDIGVFEVDLASNRSVVSDTWKRIMRVPDGMSPEEYQQYFMDSLLEEDREQLYENDRACVMGETDVSRTDCRVRLDGGIFWMRMEAVVSERDSEGRALKFLGTQIDITERMRLETAKSDFVSTVSHELRTPITSVKGAVQLLNHQFQNSQNSINQKLVRIAMSNIDHLTELVNDILDFEKVNSDQMTFASHDIRVSDLLQEARSDLEPYAVSMKSVLRIEAPVPDVVILADRQRLGQVLRNLISNACKFSPNGDIVTIGAALVGSSCRIYVRDQGEGVSAKFLPELFKPFAQADHPDNRKTNGTGLGLSISRRFVQEMGGQIGYERINETTSEFWVSFGISSQEGRQVDTLRSA